MKEQLEELFAYTEAQPVENPRKIVTVKAVANLYSFNTDRLHARRRDVAALCKLLPYSFHQSVGEHFRQMTLDADGNRWGGPVEAEKLLAMALATHQADFTLPREYWPFMPSGEPYVVLSTMEVIDHARPKASD